MNFTNYFVVFLLFFGINFHIASAQINSPGKKIYEVDYRLSEDSLLQIFSENKEFNQDYQLPALVALSFYPELIDVKVIFQSKKIKTTMACRPKINFIFQKKQNRTYIIYINNDTIKKNGDY